MEPDSYMYSPLEMIDSSVIMSLSLWVVAVALFMKYCPYPISGIYTRFCYVAGILSGAASQAGDADSSRAPGLTSDLPGPMNVHRV